MKATVDISDALFAQTKALAAARGTTLRSLIEQGLRHVLNEQSRAKPFKLRDRRVRGVAVVSSPAQWHAALEADAAKRIAR